MDELPTNTIIYIYDLIGKPLLFDIMRYVIEYAMDRELEEENGIVSGVNNRFGGKLFGLSVTYHEFAKIASATYYLDDKCHGLSRRWTAGNRNCLKHEENFNHGALHGKQIYYYESGAIRSIVHKNNGNFDGETIKYDTAGSILQKTMYINNDIISLIAYRGGNPVINTIYNGDYSTITCYSEEKVKCVIPLFKNKRHGKAATFSDGANELICFYDNGLLHGKAIMWYAPEQLEYEAEYVHGKLEGLVRKWDSTGNLEISAFFVGGKLHGEYKARYLEKGKLVIHNFHYMHGIMNGKCMISKKDTVIFNADMKDGLIDGVLELKYVDGETMATAEYSRGMLHGNSRIYSKEGILLYQAAHKHNVLISETAKNRDEAARLFNVALRMLRIRGLPDIEYELDRYLVILDLEYEINHGNNKFNQYSDDSQSEDDNAVSDGVSESESAYESEYESDNQ